MTTPPPAESPAVARRRLRLALRRAREDKGFTQHQVAEEMEWSISKVMRIESGEVTVSVNDTRSLLNYLGVTDSDEVARLVQSARDARKREWWDEARYREHVPPALRRLIQFETEARSIHYFFPMIIPGPLQVPDYARAILRAHFGNVDTDQSAARLEARQRRRQAFLSRRDAPTVRLLLDESVLQRTLGDFGLLSRQLFDLQALAEQGRVIVRIIPFTAAVALPLLGTFEIYGLGGESATGDRDNGIDDAVMYRESNLLDELVEDQAAVSRHLTVFENLWDGAHDEATSLQMIQEAAEKAAASSAAVSNRSSG